MRLVILSLFLFSYFFRTIHQFCINGNGSLYIRLQLFRCFADQGFSGSSEYMYRNPTPVIFFAERVY